VRNKLLLRSTEESIDKSDLIAENKVLKEEVEAMSEEVGALEERSAVQLKEHQKLVTDLGGALDTITVTNGKLSQATSRLASVQKQLLRCQGQRLDILSKHTFGVVPSAAHYAYRFDDEALAQMANEPPSPRPPGKGAVSRTGAPDAPQPPQLSFPPPQGSAMPAIMPAPQDAISSRRSSAPYPLPQQNRHNSNAPYPLPGEGIMAREQGLEFAPSFQTPDLPELPPGSPCPPKYPTPAEPAPYPTPRHSKNLPGVQPPDFPKAGQPAATGIQESSEAEPTQTETLETVETATGDVEFQVTMEAAEAQAKRLQEFFAEADADGADIVSKQILEKCVQGLVARFPPLETLMTMLHGHSEILVEKEEFDTMVDRWVASWVE